MPKTSLLRLAPLAVLIALSLSLSGVGLAGLGTPAVQDSGVALAPAASAQLFATPSFAGGPIFGICPEADDGCTSEGIACTGYTCCCIYSCPDGTGYAAHCRASGPGPL